MLQKIINWRLYVFSLDFKTICKQRIRLLLEIFTIHVLIKEQSSIEKQLNNSSPVADKTNDITPN